MQDILWHVQVWLVEAGWHLGQAWDSIGGWLGALQWLGIGILGGCFGWFIFVMVCELRRKPLVEEQSAEEKEPPTQPLQAVSAVQEDVDDWQHELAALAASNPEMLQERGTTMQIGKVIEMAEIELSLLWEKKEREEA